MVIVVHLVGPWADFHRRPMLEALARQASGQATIICIAPAISLRRAFSVLLRGGGKEGLLPMGGARRLADNLYVGTPVVSLPGAGRSSQKTGSMGWRQIGRQVRQAVRKIAPAAEKTIAWVYRPEQLSCLGLAGEQSVVYECYDEYCLSFRDGSEVPGIEDTENHLLQEADIVFATSRALFESRKTRHANVNYAPNGVDFDLFNAAVKEDMPIAGELNGIPRPRIGYIGALYGLTDFPLLDHIVRQEGNWSLIIIGPVGDEFKPALAELRRHANVHYLGHKTRELLPQYLTGFDACILPFKTNRRNRSSNPLTLWEYLAAGKPVVSIPIKEMAALEGLVWLAEDHTAFVAAIKSALCENDKKRIACGVEIARQHSWETLTSEMFKILRRDLEPASSMTAS